jgi:hypothetical protein
MELRFGADFADVRIHTGAMATQSARGLNAIAYTVGPNVVFEGDHFAPHTEQGRQTLAHELTHVLQQARGPVSGSSAGGGGLQISDPSDRFEREAEQNAAHVKENGPLGVVALPAEGPVSTTVPGSVQRFASFEHVQLGDTATGGPSGFIVLECHRRDLPNHATPTHGWPQDWIDRYNRGTPEQRRVISQGLSYGEILALSGDMYADINPTTMGTSVTGTMDRINKASLLEIYNLVPLIASSSEGQRRHLAPEASSSQLEDATGGRYMTLAQKNLSHFTNVGGGRNNLATWRDGHAAALSLAQQGDANAAWAMNAAADHFLTDAFSSGHLRQDRAALTSSKPGQISALIQHDLDNVFGVAVHNLRGDRWVDYGDDHLNDRANTLGLRIAVEAESMSKADIQRALGTAPPPGTSPSAAGTAVLSVPYPAERLIPIVDNPAVDRWNPVVGAAVERGRLLPELPDQLTPNGDLRAREWAARQPPAALRDMPVEEKVRMVNRLMDGWVSGEDLDGIERLYDNSSPKDQATLRADLGQRASSLSIGQRTRLRFILSR